MWELMVQEANGRDIWTATAYTAPRIDKAGRMLVAENRSIEEGRHDRDQASLNTHLPQDPPGRYDVKNGSWALERINAQLVRALLRKVPNTSAPGDDQILADVGIASRRSGVARRWKRHRSNGDDSNAVGSNGIATAVARGSW